MLSRLVQMTSVYAYLYEFRRIILATPGMHDGEQVNRFCQGLKPQVKLEFLKLGAQTMVDATTIALNVDYELFGAGMKRHPHQFQWKLETLNNAKKTRRKMTASKVTTLVVGRGNAIRHQWKTLK